MTRSQRTVLSGVRLLLLMGVVGFFWWLIAQNFPANRQIVLTSKWGIDQSMISRLHSESGLTIDGSDQILTDNSTWFDIRSLPWFRSASLVIEYQAANRTIQDIRVQADGSEATYKPLTDFEIDTGWRQAIFTVNVTSLPSRMNARRIFIDTPGTGELRFRSVTVSLEQ